MLGAAAEAPGAAATAAGAAGRAGGASSEQQQASYGFSLADIPQVGAPGAL